MKKIFFFLSLAVVLISCPGPKKPDQKRELIKDDFGIADSLGKDTQAITAQERLLQTDIQAGRPPWKKKPVVYPPADGGGTGATNIPALLYVEFNGGVVSSTWWNVSGDITLQGSGLTIDQIQAVMDSAATRFKGFNVILTTDKALYNSYQASRKAICFITISNEWYGAGAGGVAFRNTFGQGQPCFIFSKLLNYRLKYIWEDIPHEFGHVLGCYDEQKTDASCNVLGPYSYLSIMGVAYYINNPTWSKNCREDTYQTIKAKTQ